jgi:hypothetical protein
MPVTFSGRYGLQLQAVIDLLANVSAFQTWTGTDDATAAKGRIYVVEKEDDSYTRPCALVSLSEDWRVEEIASGTFAPAGTGSAAVVFSAAVADTYSDDREEGAKDFINDVSGIVDGLCDTADDGGYVLVTSIGPAGPPEESDQSQGTTHYYSWEWRLDIGISGGAAE